VIHVTAVHISIPEGGLFTSQAIITAARGAVEGCVGLPLTVNAELRAVGFTRSGIAVGSIAGGIQSGIGNVGAGSLCAAAQSLGALGEFGYFGSSGLWDS